MLNISPKRYWCNMPRHEIDQVLANQRHNVSHITLATGIDRKYTREHWVHERWDDRRFAVLVSDRCYEYDHVLS